ncbi:MAG: hypothetical protein E7295_12650 [Lachnospiraceae bacterium]|nr:hypothetical protein [Lachnospiraceae bacterium]
MAVFILLLLLFTSRGSSVVSGEAFPENLAVFASYEQSAAERAPNKEESFTGHSYVLTNKMHA